MTDRLAWLLDANIVSEMMRPRPEPRVAAFHDSIAEEGIGVASSRRTTQNSNSTHPLRIGPLVISCMVAG